MPHAAPSPPLVLASSSPRRRELLARAGLRFRVEAPRVEERRRPGEPPDAFVLRLAREKASAVAATLGAPRRLVLGADTVVVLGDDVLGKPRDADDALVLLRRLCGREHRVLTGVAVVASDTGETRSRVVESRVALREVPEAELRAYVATGEPLDKAGGYAVQGGARAFVRDVRGSVTNVIGLPVDETLALLAELAPARAAEPR